MVIGGPHLYRMTPYNGVTLGPPKQKKVIEGQKQLVDEAYKRLHEKNREMIDSINYAKRIQDALITSERYIENCLRRLINTNAGYNK